MNKKFYNVYYNTNLDTIDNYEEDYANKWFVNITDKVIPHDVAKFASLGPKYSIPGNINKDNLLHFM